MAGRRSGPTDMFPDDNYIPVVITLTPGIGEAGKTTVYVRKHNPSIDTDPYDQHTPYIAITSALRAPRLPGALGARRRALHLPVPRRRLRPARPPRRRAAAAAARPLLHAREHGRPGRDRPALQRQQRAAPLLAARPRRAARRHRPVPVPVASLDPHARPMPKLPAPADPRPAEGAAAAARRADGAARPARAGRRGRDQRSSTGSTSAPR